ncbi:MAG: hypothetical protein VYC17_02840 [Nitrospinota bacterium]|nr:hypothetical protein [Nitrospinota bacterium]
MIRTAINLVILMVLGLGFQACDLYNAAFKDTKRTATSSSEETASTTLISVSPTGRSFSTSETQAFTASGGAGSFSWTLSGQTNNFSGVSFQSTTTTSATVVFTIPTALEGAQTITVTATDNTQQTGLAILTLEPATS